MDWTTLTMGIAAAGIVAFVIGGYRASTRTGMFGRSMLENAGRTRQERAAQRDRFWAGVFGPDGGLDRWLIFGGAASVVAAVLVMGVLAG